MNGTKYVVFQEGRVTTDGEIRIKKKMREGVMKKVRAMLDVEDGVFP